jgi:ABC-type nickel/cobalt efflux system permease component RcnA
VIAALSGLIAGVVHVLTGPDHLTAVAPLAVQRPVRSWVPGVRWGIGHSAGVVVVGLLSLWLRDLLPVDLLSSWGERLVGVMLVGIGLWAFRKALKNTVHTHEHEHDRRGLLHVHTHHHHKKQGQPEAHLHTHAAFGIGILHGLAGSSHFLGVLPVLAMPTKGQAVAYLAAFGLGTIVAMAAFSWGVGLVAQRWSVSGQKVYRRLMSTCAAAAMGVGCFWLVTSF